MSAGNLAPRLAELEQLLGEVERTADPELLARARQIVSVVLELHAAGLERMLELVGSGADVAGCARDPLVGSLLLLHGLHPQPLETRVREALAQFGQDVALTAITDGVVRLQLAAPRQRVSVMEAVSAAAPDAIDIVIDGADHEAPLISVEQLLTSRHERP